MRGIGECWFLDGGDKLFTMVGPWHRVHVSFPSKSTGLVIAFGVSYSHSRSKIESGRPRAESCKRDADTGKGRLVVNDSTTYISQAAHPSWYFSIIITYKARCSDGEYCRTRIEARVVEWSWCPREILPAGAIWGRLNLLVLIWWGCSPMENRPSPAWIALHLQMNQRWQFERGRT